MSKVRIIKVMTCIYGSKKLYEDEDWCIVHSSKRRPGKEYCEAVWQQAMEELKKPLSVN